MVDIFDEKKRKDVMSRIKAKNTSPEIAVRSLLHKLGYRFRLHDKRLPGSPDIVLPRFKVAIFVHGCFWHRHAECKRGSSFPSSNTDFWRAKFENTVNRDFKALNDLIFLGWKPVIIWECMTKNIPGLTAQIFTALTSDNEKDQP